MSRLTIRTFPDPCLRKLCLPVKQLDSATLAFIDQLIETMHRQPGGIGIAAPQVGVMRQIAIVDVSRKVPSARQLVLVNPAVCVSRGKKILREGCMSLPDFTANVARATDIEIEILGRDGNRYRHRASGLEAICIQHELDHLNGMLFIDRVASLKSDVFRRKRYL